MELDRGMSGIGRAGNGVIVLLINRANVNPGRESRVALDMDLHNYSIGAQIRPILASTT